MMTSSGSGRRPRIAQQVRRNSTARFRVVQITDIVGIVSINRASCVIMYVSPQVE
jgi:hypothetical protein